jgi:hypothetical protein
MSINGLVASVAIAFTLAGTIARACKHPGAQGTQEMSATPNSNSVRNNNAVSAFSSKSKAEVSRNLGTALCAA